MLNTQSDMLKLGLRKIPYKTIQFICLIIVRYDNRQMYFVTKNCWKKLFSKFLVILALFVRSYHHAGLYLYIDQFENFSISIQELMK